MEFGQGVSGGRKGGVGVGVVEKLAARMDGG